MSWVVNLVGIEDIEIEQRDFVMNLRPHTSKVATTMYILQQLFTINSHNVGVYYRQGESIRECRVG